MSKLVQINLSNGNSYATKVSDINDFYKEKIYELSKGCIVKVSHSPEGEMITQLFDISKNDFYSSTICINPNCIVEVRAIKKNSDMEKLYHKVTLNIITLPQNSKLN